MRYIVTLRMHEATGGNLAHTTLNQTSRTEDSLMRVREKAHLRALHPISFIALPGG